ncbi:MAG: hypothetical protein FJ261_13480 [Planctomycetes bacterium]|nr:hypothetical protein [Planctomycetota bacterium]
MSDQLDLAKLLELVRTGAAGRVRRPRGSSPEADSITARRESISETSASSAANFASSSGV